MNLPADPRERRRMTAAILHKRYGKQCNVQDNLIRQNGPILEEDATDEWQCTSSREQQVKNSSRISHDVHYRPIERSSQYFVHCLNGQQHCGIQQQAERDKQSLHSPLDEFTGTICYSTSNNNNRLSASNAISRHIGDCDKETRKKLLQRLSLPNDTLISKSFLSNHAHKLTQSDECHRPLSRLDRRQSLLDIGFGKLSTYKKLHILGSGTYSIVYKGVSRLTNKYVALKEIHLEREEGVPFTAIREVSLLKQLKHNNIVTLHDIIYNSRTLTLVFEYVDRDLSHYMEDCDHKINLDNVKLFLFQLLRALKYCHQRKVLHRDIKPQNILISHSGELKLADFGLARAKSFPTKTYTDEVVTLWYRPPDILLGNVDYDSSIDMWGVGCIFFEMAAGFTLFLGTDPKRQIGSIFEIIGTPDESDWPTIKSDLQVNSIDIPHYAGRDLASVTPRLDEIGIDLLKRLLKCNPSLRISSADAMLHKYFRTFPPEIYDLRDSLSIFTIPTLRLSNELTRNSMSILQNVNV